MRFHTQFLLPQNPQFLLPQNPQFEFEQLLILNFLFYLHFTEITLVELHCHNLSDERVG